MHQRSVDNLNRTRGVAIAAEQQRRPGRPRYCAPGGFTLLELILVLVIVAVILGLSSVMLRGAVKTQRVDNAAGQFVALCQRARSSAITQATPHDVQVDLKGRSYHITREINGVQQRIDAEWGSTFTLPDGVRMLTDPDAAYEGALTIRFLPDGRSQSANLMFAGEGRAVIVTRDTTAQRFLATPVSDGDLSTHPVSWTAP